MKKYFIFISLAFISSLVYAQNVEDMPCSEELKALGKSVFENIQNKNFSEYQKYIVTEENVDTMAKYIDITPEMIEITKRSVRYSNDISKKQFNDVLKQGRKQGIDWAKAELTDFMCEIDEAKDAPRGDLVLLGKYNDTMFMIELNAVVIKSYLSEKWLLFGKVKLYIHRE